MSNENALEQLRKGQLLIVKVPPLYNKEYFYEIISAGEKQIRANLYHSPTVKRSWTREEFALLLEHKILRLATAGEKPATQAISDPDE